MKAALAGYVKIKFQAEDPDASPAKEVMQRFDAVGLPDLRDPAAEGRLKPIRSLPASPTAV